MLVHITALSNHRFNINLLRQLRAVLHQVHISCCLTEQACLGNFSALKAMTSVACSAAACACPCVVPASQCCPQPLFGADFSFYLLRSALFAIVQWFLMQIAELEKAADEMVGLESRAQVAEGERDEAVLRMAVYTPRPSADLGKLGALDLGVSLRVSASVAAFR